MGNIYASEQLSKKIAESRATLARLLADEAMRKMYSDRIKAVNSKMRPVRSNVHAK